MKQFLSGLCLSLLLVGIISFSTTGKSAKAGAYWFALDGFGNDIPQSVPPSFVSADPYRCGKTGGLYCSRGYTTYEMVPGSFPTTYRGKSGTDITTHYKP